MRKWHQGTGDRYKRPLPEELPDSSGVADVLTGSIDIPPAAWEVTPKVEAMAEAARKRFGTAGVIALTGVETSPVYTDSPS